MNPGVLLRYAPSLISGFGVTVLCWSAGGALGLLLGFFVALLYRLPFAPLRWLLRYTGRCPPSMPPSSCPFPPGTWQRVRVRRV